jgi:hypothetical protein
MGQLALYISSVDPSKIFASNFKHLALYHRCLFLVDAWFWSSYPWGMLIIVASALPFLEIENKQLMGTYIQPSPKAFFTQQA